MDEARLRLTADVTDTDSEAAMRTPSLLLLAVCVTAACDAPDRTIAPNGPDAPNATSGRDLVVGPGQPPVLNVYSLVDISGGLPGRATDVNDSGWVVGTHTVSGGDHGFVRHADGTIEDLPPLSGDVSNVATGINNAYQIVGTSTASNGTTHAWRRLPGHALERLGDADCAGAAHANAIDDVGEIVGGCDFTPAEWHADSSTHWRDKWNAGDLFDAAAHVVVGLVSGPGTDFDNVLWDYAEPLSLPMPHGTVHSRVNGVNDSHEMVGEYEVGHESPSGGSTITSSGGFFFTHTVTHPIPHAAYGVSTKSRIVGWYVSIPAVAYTIAPNGISPLGIATETALPPSGVNRVAVRVNACGTIVGHYFPSGLSGGARAAMWRKPVCD